MLRPMRRSNLDELARDPVGRYVAGDAFLHFCADPGFWGVVLWGRPDHGQALELGRSLMLGLAPPAQPHVTLFDVSRLEGSEPAAFRAAERYVSHFSGLLGQYVRRLALVRPSGMYGAVVAGAFDVMTKPFPVQVFGDTASACEWLGVDGAGLVAELHAEVTGTPRILPALRGFLDQHLSGVSLEEAARALAVSARSLQRKLGEAGTTFQDELADARVRLAKRLLLDGQAPLTTIALDVGCASLQHFSALFRKRTSETPSAYRRRHKKSENS
jgi:AraC-like DNA-binding protein